MVSLVLVLLTVLVDTSLQFKGRGACSVVYEGCNIISGRCVCSRTTDRCYNTFSFSNETDCRHELFKQFTPALTGGSSSSGVRAARYLYPHCMAAQFLPLCSPRHVGTKYCHGSCDSSCCVISFIGCLPPTNVYVPAESCAIAEQDVCQDYQCKRGYKCESVKEGCPVLPCKKQPKCVVDEDYDPCPMVTCSQEHGSKVCVRQRRPYCKECSYTFRCVSVTGLIRPPTFKNGCGSCPRISTQESFCRNHFALRIRVQSLLWEKRRYKTLGLCDWYNVTVEYGLKQNVPVTVVRNATILVKSRQPDSCSCLSNITPGQRYMIIGKSLVVFPQKIHIPQDGFIKPWQLVKRRSQYMNLENCPGGLDYS